MWFEILDLVILFLHSLFFQYFLYPSRIQFDEEKNERGKPVFSVLDEEDEEESHFFHRHSICR